MAGIYIHIPFCKQKCHYCNFYSLASRKHDKAFLSALIREISLQKKYLGGETVNSIYLGGGTPSLFGEPELNEIFSALFHHYSILKDAEITLEANPDDMGEEFLKQLRSSPVNRLSIGVQSFRDEDLRYLNRVHSAGQAERAVSAALDHGYSNLSLDLIFGIPTLDDRGMRSNLDRFLSFEVPHLSAYALTVEPKTALDVLIKKGKMKAVDEEKTARQFLMLVRALQQNGYSHYEISNFSKPHFQARHNTNYWLGEKYLGLGPSAHSFDGRSRQWNVSNLASYISGMEIGNPVFEQEVLSAQEQYNEYVMVSLRTSWGVDREKLTREFGKIIADYFIEAVQKFIDRGLVEHADPSYILTEAGKLHADGIAAELFWPEEVG